MATLNFDATQIQTTSHDPLPAGVYEAVVSASETRPTKNGSGVGINLTFDVVSGEYANRKVFAWINFKHASAKAQQIGQEELASLCRAVGVTQLNDTVQLHDIPLLITVGIDRNDPTKNVIRKYAAKSGTGATASVQQQGAGSGAAPWAR